jgi:hypothetical protein
LSEKQKETLEGGKIFPFKASCLKKPRAGFLKHASKLSGVALEGFLRISSS